MANPALEFTLLMETGAVRKGMSAAKTEVAAGLRGMSQAANAESRRIETALGNITAFRELKKGVVAVKAEMEKAKAETTRLGSAMARASQPVKQLKTEIDNAKKAVVDAKSGYQQHAASLRTLKDVVSEAKAEWTKAKTEVTKLNTAIRQSKSPTKEMRQELERAKKASADAKASYQQQNLALREYRKTVASAKAEVTKANAEVTRLATEMAKAERPIRGLKRAFDNARKAAAEAHARFQQQSAALNTLRRTMAETGMSTTGLSETQRRLRANLLATQQNFRNLAREMQRTQDARNVLNLGPRVNTTREIQRLRAAYERLRASGNQTAAEMARAHVRMTEGIIALRNGTDSWAERLSLVREQIAKLAIATATIGLASREAIAFEAAMTDVRKVVDFPTPGAFKEMAADIKAMSREIPVSLEGLAQIAVTGGQMGIAAKEIRGFTEVVSKMSTAFKISADEAATAIGRLMNIFNLSVAETQRLGDAINHLGNNTNAAEHNILNVMNRTGGMARVFGLASTETAALGTAFLALGRPPEIAATAINALMLILQTAPTREASFKQALARIGFSAEKLALDISKAPQRTLMKFLDTLKTLDKQTQSETLANIFGRQYADDIAILLTGLDTYKKTLKLVTRETNFAGSMQKEFNELVKTTQAQLQLAKNAISEAAVNLGSAFLPAIVAVSKAVASITHVIAGLADQFPVLSAAAISAVTAFAGFSALRLVWSVIRAGLIGLIAPLGSLAVAARALALTPLGAVLTAASMAAYAFSKATESTVTPLLENAAALNKSRRATAEKIKTLEALKRTLETTQPGTREHVEAEEKLAAILPDANLSLDEQGRVLARVSDAARENVSALNQYLDLLKREDRQTLALQLDAQSRAFMAAKKELASYTEGLRSWYGIGTGVAQTATQHFWMWLNKLTGGYDNNIAKGAEMRRQLADIESGLNGMLAEAQKAGLSVDDLARAMDGVHVDPAVKEHVTSLYRAMASEAQAASANTSNLKDNLRQFSIAIAGPVAASKKAITDAIDAADLQLGKYNKALIIHSGLLKQAVNDESQSWKAISDVAATANKTITDRIGEEYDRRRQKLDATVDAGLISERRHVQAIADLAVRETEVRLAEARRYRSLALELVDSEFQTKLEHAERLGHETARIDEERLQARRKILSQIETAHRQSIDKLIAEERRHTDAARQLAEQRAGFNTSIADRLTRLAEKGMSQSEIYAARQTRIAREQALAEEALQAGKYGLARKHAERMITLAEQTSDAVSEGNRERNTHHPEERGVP